MKKIRRLIAVFSTILFLPSFFTLVSADENNPTTKDTSTFFSSSETDSSISIDVPADMENEAEPTKTDLSEDEKDKQMPTNVTPSLLKREQNFLALYLEKGYITQVQHDDTIIKLSEAKDDQGLLDIMNELGTKLGFEASSLRNSWAEKYYNITANVKALVEQSKLSKKEAEDYMVRLDATLTTEELDTIWQEIESKVASTEESVTESSEEATSESTNKKSTSTMSTEMADEKKDEGKKLPQTGESTNGFSYVIIGMAMLLITGLVLRFKIQPVKAK